MSEATRRVKTRRAWSGDRLVECVNTVYDLMLEAPIRIASRVIEDAIQAGLSENETKRTLAHMTGNSLLYEFEAHLDMRLSVNDTERSDSYIKCRYLALSATRVLNSNRDKVPLVTAINNGVPIHVVLPTLYRKRKRPAKAKKSVLSKKAAAVAATERETLTSLHSSVNR